MGLRTSPALPSGRLAAAPHFARSAVPVRAQEGPDRNAGVSADARACPQPWALGRIWLLIGWAMVFCGVLGRPATAAEWPMAPIQATDSVAAEPRYLYVGKGQAWQEARFIADYDASSDVFTTVSLNGQLLSSQYLRGQGSLEVALPVLQPGFHRLDFGFWQRGELGHSSGDREDYCAAGSGSTVVLRGSRVAYRAEYPQGHRLQHLPDALFNPHSQNARPYIGVLRLNRQNDDELTAAARLTSAWPAAAGVHWHDAALMEQRAAGIDFGIALEHVPGLEELAAISLEMEPTEMPSAAVVNGASALLAAAPIAEPAEYRPVLRIQYRTGEGLQQAVHAVLNPRYLAQLTSTRASISEYVEPPRWASLRAIQTLADLGLQDMRLDGGSRDLQLVFPGAWGPTDILQGQLALNAQSGLLPGSKLTVWIDGALAGSINFSQPASASASGERTLSFQAPRPGNATSFDVRLETTLITNNDCLPRSRGALWIDAAKSSVTLPHHIKSGIAGISAALVPHPTVRVDGSPGSLDIALSLLQVASGMLLDGQPVPATIVTGRGAGHTVTVEVDPAMYRQRIATHPDKVYAPYAEHGVLLLQLDQQFRVVAETADSVATFLEHWPRLQPRLPDGAREVLLAQDGDLIVLSRYVASTKVTPAMRPTTISMLGGLILLLLLGASAWWYWRGRRQRRQAQP